jgi:mRNA-degrading endonuclease RelE of RelBE toxin-antitoxin system
LHSFRVGNYRIIYRIFRKHVEIVALGPRQKIYEETFLILKREGAI